MNYKSKSYVESLRKIVAQHPETPPLKYETS